MSVNSVQIEAQLHNRADFSDEFEVKRWLQGRPEGTKHTYVSALKAFIDYTKLSPKNLIDLAEQDREKSSRQRGDPESKIKGFYEWLITEYLEK